MLLFRAHHYRQLNYKPLNYKQLNYRHLQSSCLHSSWLASNCRCNNLMSMLEISKWQNSMQETKWWQYFLVEVKSHKTYILLISLRQDFVQEGGTRQFLLERSLTFWVLSRDSQLQDRDPKWITYETRRIESDTQILKHKFAFIEFKDTKPYLPNAFKKVLSDHFFQFSCNSISQILSSQIKSKVWSPNLINLS